MSNNSAEYKELLDLKSSGKYVPPTKLKALQTKINNSSESTTEEYQVLQWEQLKRSINRQVNKCNVSNIREIVVELFKLNLQRGKGLLIRSIMKAQLTDLIFTPIYASLIAVLNSKISEIGELILHRLLLQFRKNYVKNKKNCISSAIFIVHLINQRVCSEILILQILQLLLENPTNDSIEICVEIMNQVGKYLQENSVAANNMIFNRLRSILHENEDINDRSQFLIENLFKTRKNGYSEYPIIRKELDLVEFDDQETHLLELDAKVKSNDQLNIFQFDEQYDENEKLYDNVRKDILGDSDEEDDESEAEESEEDNKEILEIKDMTESNLLNYQKTVYLTVMSSMSSDEAVHKLIKLNFKKSNQEKYKNNEILVDMIIKCCSQEKTYSKYYGVIGEKLCSMNKHWHTIFIDTFKKYYSTIHQFETNSLRNIGKFFGHLFALDKLAIERSWNVIKLTEEETNSASRIFIKFIFQEIIEEIGIKGLQERLDDDLIRQETNGLFPRQGVTYRNAEDIRFSINFFTAIGLGILTEEMRDVLKNLPPEERGRSRSVSGSSRSSSYSRSRSYSRSSGSYSRSRSRSRSHSGSRSRSRSKTGSRGRTMSRDRSKSFSRSRSTSRSRGESFSRSPSRSPTGSKRFKPN